MTGTPNALPTLIAHLDDTLTQINISTPTGNSSLHFTYDELGPMSVTYDGAEYFYLKNAQGDVTGLVNSSGTQVVAYTYDAWGNPLTTTGTMADTLGKLNPFRYRGYVYDTETGLYYLQSRYYNPETGRFINADGYVSTGQGILGDNAVAYCQNNPVRFGDTEGAFINAAIGAVVGGLSVLINNSISGKQTTTQDLLVGVATGAIAGIGVDFAIATAGAGAIAWAGFTGAVSGALQYTYDVKTSGEDLDWIDLLFNASLGAASNLLSFAISIPEARNTTNGNLVRRVMDNSKNAVQGGALKSPSHGKSNKPGVKVPKSNYNKKVTGNIAGSLATSTAIAGSNSAWQRKWSSTRCLR